MTHLNYFFPYRNKESWHEDVLTRAFLTVLKHSLMSQAVFIDMIREVQLEKKEEDDLIPPLSATESIMKEIDTQKSSINLSEGKVISVVIADIRYESIKEVQPGKDPRRYDGIINYGDKWAIVIENKLNVNNVFDQQLHPKIDNNQGLEVSKTLINLSWKELIDRLTSLLQKDFVHYSEKIILDDFFYLLFRDFSYLNPFRKFSMCNNIELLLAKKCGSVLENIIGNSEVSNREAYASMKSEIAIRVYLNPITKDEENYDIRLAIYPAVTVEQGRKFYNNVDQEKLFNLCKKDNGWDIFPNMLFTYIGSQRLSKKVEIDSEKYLDFWLKEENRNEFFGQSRKGDVNFEKLFNDLIDLSFINNDDFETLAKEFIQSNREHVNIIPGIGMYYKWSKESVVAFDEKGRFEHEVEKQIIEAYSLWGEEEIINKTKEKNFQ